ncbi:hypothetical protein Trydic_g18014 [Trypoxylus dichotomus]
MKRENEFEKTPTPSSKLEFGVILNDYSKVLCWINSKHNRTEEKTVNHLRWQIIKRDSDGGTIAQRSTRKSEGGIPRTTNGRGTKRRDDGRGRTIAAPPSSKPGDVEDESAKNRGVYGK